MNHTELTAAIQDYLQQTETTFVANIDRFIQQAEERINRDVTIPDLRKITTTSLTTSSRDLTKPSDYLSTISIVVTRPVAGAGGGDPDVDTDKALLMKDYDFLREAYPTTVEGLPVYYAHLDEATWQVAPIPDSDYAVTISYYYDPPSIVTASTSWLGDNAESVLLYGCLIEAYTFLKGSPDLIQVYEQRYGSALQNLIDLGMLRSKRDDYRGGELRMEA
jgi:hypothetical protein